MRGDGKPSEEIPATKADPASKAKAPSPPPGKDAKTPAPKDTKTPVAGKEAKPAEASKD